MLRAVFFVLLCLALLCALLFSCRVKEKPSEPSADSVQEPSVLELPEAAQESETEKAAENADDSSQTAARISYHVQKPMSLSALSSRLPAFGVNLREIDPVNYENPDVDVLRQMGTEQYLISFFAGEQFYKENDFDRAIAEYTSSINGNREFAQAFVSLLKKRRI